MTNPTNNRDSFDNFIAELNGEQEIAFGDPSSGEPVIRENLDTDEAEMMLFYEVIGQNAESEQLTSWLDKYKAFKAEQKAGGVVADTHNPDLFDEYVFINTEERYYRRKHMKNGVKQGAFNAEMSIHIPKEDGRKLAGSAHWYFAEHTRNFADILGYAPGQPEYFHDEGSRCFNTFVQPKYPAEKAYEDNDVVLRIKRHLDRYYPDEQENIIKWWAHNVQHPGKKINWALAFIGNEGTGKGLSERVLRSAMTSRVVTNVSSTIVNSGFMDWAWGSCVCVIDELSVENKKQTMDSFKDVITNARLSINRKGLTFLEGVRNTQNYIITSNHFDALPVSKSDRRWFVLDDRIASVAEVKKEFGEEDYYSKMYDPLQDPKDDASGAVRAWLLSVDTSGMPFLAPTRWAKTEMFTNTRSNDFHSILEMIEDAGLNPAMVSTKKLGWLYKEDNGTKINPKWLATILKEMGMVPLEKTIKDKGKLNHKVYYKPSEYSADTMSNEDIKTVCQIDTDFQRV